MVSVKYVDIVLALVSYFQFSTGYALTVQELQLAHIWLRNRQPVSLRRSIVPIGMIPGMLAYYSQDPRVSVLNLYFIFIMTLMSSILTYRLSPVPSPCSVSRTTAVQNIQIVGRLHCLSRETAPVSSDVARAVRSDCASG